MPFTTYQPKSAARKTPNNAMQPTPQSGAAVGERWADVRSGAGGLE